MNLPPDPIAGRQWPPRGFAPLGYRDFALYWIGFVVSNTGRWVEVTGTVWLVYELTDSPVLLGLVGVARAIPAILLSPIAGVVADRVDQRRLIFATQGIALVLSFTIGILVLLGAVQLWQVYLQVALQSAVLAFDAAARQALFPRLVPRALLPESVALNSTAGRTSKLVGPLIGGVSIAVFGEAAPFLLNAVSFLALMALILMISRVAPPAILPGASFRGELSEGFRYIMRAPVLSGLLRLEIVFSLFQLNEVIITIVARESLGVGPEGLGGLLAAPALGALVGLGGLLAIGQSPRQGRSIVVCTVAYGGALVTFAMSGSYAVALVALVVAGFFDVIVTVTRHSVMQLAAPGQMRGRVMANMGMVTRGLGPLGQVQSGVLAATIGPQLTVLTSAAVLATAAVATARSNPAVWRFRRETEHVEPVVAPAVIPPDTPA